MSRELRWTEHAIGQLGAIAEYIGLDSAVYADQTLRRLSVRLRQVVQFPESGRTVPEFERADIREVLEDPDFRLSPETIEVLAVVHARQDFVRNVPKG